MEYSEGPVPIINSNKHNVVVSVNGNQGKRSENGNKMKIVDEDLTEKECTDDSQSINGEDKNGKQETSNKNGTIESVKENGDENCIVDNADHEFNTEFDSDNSPPEISTPLINIGTKKEEEKSKASEEKGHTAKVDKDEKMVVVEDDLCKKNEETKVDNKEILMSPVPNDNSVAEENARIPSPVYKNSIIENISPASATPEPSEVAPDQEESESCIDVLDESPLDSVHEVSGHELSTTTPIEDLDEINLSSSSKDLVPSHDEVADVEDERGSFSDDSADDVIDLSEAIRRQIADRRAKEAADPEFSKDIDLILRLEQADGCYVCTMCPLDTCFSCWEVREFFEHIMVSHKNQDTSSHVCPYCAQPVLIKQLERHTNRHLQQDCSPRFACPLCPDLPSGEVAFRCNSFIELQLHMRTSHAEATRESRPLRCVHCARLCASMNGLFRHLDSSTISVSHCTVTGCLVKSHNRRVLMRHMRQYHPGLGANILITTEMICADLSDVPAAKIRNHDDSQSPVSLQRMTGREDETSDDLALSTVRPQLDEDVSSIGGGTEVSAVASGIEPGFNAGMSATPRGHVFCLRCPYCRLSTIRWPKFLRHQVTCTAAGSAGFFHRLFFCSECFAVSTERQLLVDHISSEHVHAQLVEEEVLASPARSSELDSAISALASLTGIEKPDADPAVMAAALSSMASLAGVPNLLSTSTPKQIDPSPTPLTPVETGGSPDRSVELVSFPFDEEKFRETCASKHSPLDIDRVLEKMRRFCTYSVRILGKENHRRIPECPECHKAFPYGLGDFKRHLLTVHLDVPREFIRDCLHFTQLPKGEEKFNELQEQLAMRNFRPKVIEPGKKRIPLPFSAKVLRRLTEGLSRDAQDYLVQKMKLYSTKFAIVDSRSTNKKYKCGNCTYASAHALADVRKHILGSHCGISTKHFRFCLQSSRLDPISFTLLSEDKLLRLAKHTRRFPPRSHLHHLSMHRRMGFMRRGVALSAISRRHEGVNALKTQSSSDGPGGASSSEDQRVEEEREERVQEGVLGTDEEDEDAGIEGETMDDEEGDVEMDELDARYAAGLLGTHQSPDASSAIISAPTHGPVVFPGSMPSTAPPTLTSSTGTLPSGTGDEIPLPSVLPALIPASGLLRNSDMLGASEGFLSSPSFIPRQRNVDCFSVPTGVEFEETIRLPFSEPVLRRLLSGTCDSTTEEMIVERMHVYSSYELLRMGTGSRTLAFKCRCNRIFNTSRLPGRRMRPSTLADTRRHVMGVHARIPHEYLTVCCQASRISRENNWALYSDEMLLKLAADRPTKLMISRSSDEGSGPTHAAPRVSRVAPVPASAWGAPSPATSSSVASPGDRSNHVKVEPFENEAFSLRGGDLSMVSKRDVDQDRSEHESGTEDGNRSTENNSHSVDPPPTVTNQVEEDPTAYLRVDQAKNAVDRTISLPYSMEALRYLTDGYCHPDYLDTLREKMDCYACYKVYVTRRSGRRYFCCSGCSASSPHGLGDIRKHIVGVHAKVPERYKAAAMHCSRLSREDNSLLPLNVLLQLSKMKWRGTVIQPIGGRGSLPPSLVSALASSNLTAVGSGSKARSGESTARPPSESSGELPARDKAAKRPDEEEEEEQRKGEEEAPHKDEGKPAIFNMNESLQDPPDCPPPTNGLSLVVPPHLFIHKSRGKFGEVVYNCSTCRVSNRNIGPVRGHIVRDHMGLPGHKCFICGKLYNTKNDVLLHHKVVHTTDEEFRLSQYSPYRYAMARVCLRSEPPSSIAAGVSNAVGSSSSGPQSTSVSGPVTNPARIKKRRFKEYRFEDGSVSSHFPAPPKRRSLGPGATGVLYPPGFNLSTFPMPPPKASSTEQCYILRRKGGYLGVTFSCNVCGAKAADWDRTRAHVALFHLGSLPFRCPTCGLEHWDHVAMAEHLRDVHEHEREAAILMNCLDATPKPGAFASNPDFENAMNTVKMVNQRHPSLGPAPVTAT